MIILASTSRTRQAILSNAGLAFTRAVADVDERLLVSHNPHWTSDDISLQLAKAKAEDVSSRHPDACVIGADQVLVLGKSSFLEAEGLQKIAGASFGSCEVTRIS